MKTLLSITSITPMALVQPSVTENDPHCHAGCFASVAPARAMSDKAFGKNTRVRFTLLVILYSILAFEPCSGSSDHSASVSYVTVARYSNMQETHDVILNRTREILYKSDIDHCTTTSCGSEIVVRKDQAAQARRLLAKAAMEEKLELTLIMQDGDHDVSVSAEDIIKIHKTTKRRRTRR